MRILMVPMHLDALVVKTGSGPVIEPMADFTRQPYFNGQRDINSGVPYLSEVILSQPFEDKNLHLPPGIHLHWSLPDALTRGVSDGTELKFPRVPNRWYVSRGVKGVFTSWVIESDALSRTIPDGLAPECATIYPYLQDRQQPYRYIGRRVDFNTFIAQLWGRVPGVEHLNQKDALTAIGYGEPTFAAFYPNCASVFGTYDDLVDYYANNHDKHPYELPDGLSYVIIGWYSDAPQDAVTDLLPRPQGDAPIAQWYQDAREKLGWDIAKFTEDAAFDIPTDLVCYARLTFGASVEPPTGETKVVFGNTPSQALAAFLAFEVDASRQKTIQEQLEAILVSNVLEQSKVDTGAKFAALRHERSFNALPGGTLWTLRPDSGSSVQQGEPVALKPEKIPDDVAFALDQLNQAQSVLDRKLDKFEALSRRLYSDWVKYMMCSYPPENSPMDYPDPDAVGQFVMQTANNMIKTRTPDMELDLPTARQQAEVALGKLVLLKPDDILDLEKIWNILHQLTDTYQQNPMKPNLTDVQKNLALFAGASPPWKSNQPFSADVLQPILQILNNTITFMVKIGAEMPIQIRDQMEGIFPGAIRHRVLYYLQNGPAPRYWVPNEPVALIAGNAARHSDRFEIHHRVPCRVIFSEDGRLPGGVGAIFDLLQKVLMIQPGFRTWQSQPWHPFLLEWIVALHSAPGGVVTQNGQCAYAPTFITNNYTLPETAVDLELLPSVNQFEPTERAFRGRSILTRHAENSLTRHLAAYLARNLPAELSENFPETAEELDMYLKSFVDGDPNKHVIDDLQEKYEQRIQSKGKPDYDGGSTVYTALRAYAKLLDIPSLAQSLDGFNQALLMQKQTLQLLPADPIGFSGVSDITQTVKKAMDDTFQAIVYQTGTTPNNWGSSTAPQPLNDFNPIRSGVVEIQYLRLVDTFGQVFDLDVSTTLSGESMPGLTHDKNGVFLPPRLVQPVRLNFRFLSARLTRSDGITPLEMNSHPGTSPICGWLVPNLMDLSLSVFEADGHPLGVIRKIGDTVQWDIAPGGAYWRVADIPNSHLAGVVKELLQQATDKGIQTFWGDFMACIQEALENIEPEGHKHFDSLALLTAHPLAVVRASLDLQLKGLPANNQNWDVFSKELNEFDPQSNSDIPRDSCNFTNVQFPIRVGEYRRLNDGLVGFWRESGPSGVKPTSPFLPGFYVNSVRPYADLNPDAKLDVSSDVAKFLKEAKKRYNGRVDKRLFLATFPDGEQLWNELLAKQEILIKDLDSNIIYYADAPDLMQTIDAPPITLTMLIDPRGAVHATSGIQPVKSIQIPPEMYADALRSIEINLFSTLALTRPGRIDVPLPDLPGYYWSWLELGDEHWDEFLIGPSPALTEEFGPLEIREGWLKLHRMKGEGE
jgi:hypothetical protein